ncbi:MAG TPA: hypothetical protein VLE72_00130 [Candidatus Saccharimonadales bacterium]|nr:hypothetical protein [Candidatus Saccharimonadales bacterium]
MGNLYEGTKDLAGTMLAADRAGIAPELWDRFRADESFRNRLAEFMKNGACADPYGSTRPYANYAPPLKVFGAWEWQTFFNVALSLDQHRAANEFPWVGSSSIPQQSCPFWPKHEIMETHFAFLGLDVVHPRDPNIPPFAVTLENISVLLELACWAKRPKLSSPYTDLIEDFKGETVLSRQVKLRWYMIPLQPAGDIETGHPDEYETIGAVEWLLGQALYYQMYSAEPPIDLPPHRPQSVEQLARLRIANTSDVVEHGSVQARLWALPGAVGAGRMDQPHHRRLALSRKLPE